MCKKKKRNPSFEKKPVAIPLAMEAPLSHSALNNAGSVHSDHQDFTLITECDWTWPSKPHLQLRGTALRADEPKKDDLEAASFFSIKARRNHYNTILLSLASAHCCRAAAPREAGTIRTFALRTWIWDTESVVCGTSLQGSSICWHLELTPEPHTSPRHENKWSCREENEAQAGAKSERKRLRRGSRKLLPYILQAQLSLLAPEVERVGFGLLQLGKPCHKYASPPG